MRVKQCILFILPSILVLSIYSFRVSRPQEKEYDLKAAFLFRFLEYVEWNNAAGSAEPINIAILGESGLYGALLDLSKSKQTGSRPLKVRQINSVTEIGASQVLFVSRSYRFGIDPVLARTSDKPILIISEQKGDADKGAHINFLISDNKLKFEVNLRSASRSGIKIGSQLLQHATEIKR